MASTDPRVFRIPLANVPQRFNIDLGGLRLSMVSKWNPEAPSWVLDVFNADTDAPVILNLPLVTGVDLLHQALHLPLGAAGSFVVFTDGAQLLPPTLDNLGVEANLYFVTAPA